MKEKLMKIISTNTFVEIQDLEAIGSDELITNIGLDSINLIYVIGEIEEEFGFTFPEEDLVLEKFDTISKIMELIKKHSK
ncbi:MAG: acyl carrier protein [Anaerocolumna sp.]